MSSEIWNLNTLCRCCHADGYFKSLKLPHQAKDGSEYVYEIMLKETLGITISAPNLDASYSICNQCIEKLIDAFKFKKKVLTCEAKFKIYCTNEEFLNDPDTIKIEIENEDNDAYDDDDNESIEDKYLQRARDVKKEVIIEVDFFDPIDNLEQEEGKTESRKTESVKTNRNIKNQEKRNITVLVKKKHILRHDRSVVVEIDTENGVQYSCRTCGGCYQTQKAINLHVYRHHIIPFKCELCSKQFTNRSSYVRHKKLHSNLRFECPHCEKSFIDKTVFNDHVNTHTNQNKYICDLCHKEFKYKQTLRKHLQFHAGTLQKLLCDLCGNSFQDRTNLNIHISSVHEKKRAFNCTICARNYTTKNHLKKHIKSSHCGSKGKFQCKICDHTISCPKTFEIHMMRHENKYMCRFCKEVFDDKYKRSQHLKEKHSGTHPCHLCTKTFYSKHSLNRHIDCHNGIKRFECADCGMKFNQKVMLQRHYLRIHNSDDAKRNVATKTKCDICKKKYYNIQSHMESHTNRNHACNICGKTYPRISALNRHKEMKHFGKSFDCEMCDKQFQQRGKLNIHKIKVHKIKIDKETPSSNVISEPDLNDNTPNNK